MTTRLVYMQRKRKFRNCTAHRKRRKVDSRVVETEVKNRMILYKSLGFTFRFRIYFMNLPRNKLKVVVNVVEKLVLDGAIPNRILMAFRSKINVATKADNGKRESTNKNYMNVMFHNKGMDMINLSRILNSKKVMAAVPNYLRGPPPIVSYTYTRTITGKIFNNRKVVNELNMDCGTAGMVCSCNSSRYKYESCGHVVTGDLSIIKEVKLRNWISKGPTYREQNNIDWRVNLKNCKAAVSRYAKK